MRFPVIAYMMRCISAETLKARRTIQLLGVIAMPTVLAVLNLALMITASRENEYATPGGWLSFAHNTISFGSMLVLPCVVVLATAFSAHQEHDSGRWRTLMCLPVPKSSLYLGKLAVVSGLCLLSCLILFAENILLGGLLSILRPETGLSLARLDVLGLLLPFLLCFVYSLLLVAVHSWLSWRVQNLVATLGAGFFLPLIGTFLHDEPIWRMVVPWSLPSLVHAASGWQEGLVGLLYSVAGFATVSYLSCRSFVRRDVLA